MGVCFAHEVYLVCRDHELRLHSKSALFVSQQAFDSGQFSVVCFRIFWTCLGFAYVSLLSMKKQSISLWMYHFVLYIYITGTLARIVIPWLLALRK